MHWLVSTTTFFLTGAYCIIFPDFEFTVRTILIIMGMIFIVASLYDWYEDQQAEAAAENAGN